MKHTSESAQHADLQSSAIHLAERIRRYLWALVKWLVCGALVGAVGGLVGVAFHHCVDLATEARAGHAWLLYLLPVAGVAIVGFYRLCGVKRDEGTNLVLRALRHDNDVPLNMTPLIFVSTVLTHLCGGSAGREGAALQIGGSIGTFFGRLLRMKTQDLHIITMAGMSALFSALFGTPVTAAVFCIEVVSVGVMYHAALFPCVVSSVTAVQIAGALGVAPTAFALSAVPAFGLGILWRAALLALGCALVSILFITVLHTFEHMFQHLFQNGFVRIVVGAAVLIGLSLLAGTRDYNGAGMDTIVRAVEQGRTDWYAFLLKILFTALTISAGFKGGEIVPTFFIGSTFGCLLGGALGLDPGFSAALGLIALFCSVVNCPLASMLLAMELFGGQGLLCFAVVCAVSNLLSGYYSLYSGQSFFLSKLRPVRLPHPEEEEDEEESDGETE